MKFNNLSGLTQLKLAAAASGLIDNQKQAGYPTNYIASDNYEKSSLYKLLEENGIVMSNKLNFEVKELSLQPEFNPNKNDNRGNYLTFNTYNDVLTCTAAINVKDVSDLKSFSFEINLVLLEKKNLNLESELSLLRNRIKSVHNNIGPGSDVIDVNVILDKLIKGFQICSLLPEELIEVLDNPISLMKSFNHITSLLVDDKVPEDMRNRYTNPGQFISKAKEITTTFRGNGGIVTKFSDAKEKPYGLELQYNEKENAAFGELVLSCFYKNNIRIVLEPVNIQINASKTTLMMAIGSMYENALQHEDVGELVTPLVKHVLLDIEKSLPFVESGELVRNFGDGGYYATSGHQVNQTCNPF